MSKKRKEMNKLFCEEYDDQRELEYEWEHYYIESELSNRQMSNSSCKRLAFEICDRHGLDYPKIFFPNCKGSASCVDMTQEGGIIFHLIRLPKGMRDKVTVIHEVCHFLKHEYDSDCQHHGGVFLRILIDEISLVGSGNPHLSRSYLTRSARRAGLRVCSSRIFNYKKRRLGILPDCCKQCMRMY
jgi:hypothetical protein